MPRPTSVMARALASPGQPAVPAVGMPLDHIGIAVRDAGPFVSLFAKLVGLDDRRAGGRRAAPPAVRRRPGGATLELVEAVSADAPVAKFLDRRGEALHHLCFRVPDIDAAIAALVADGVRFIDYAPAARRARIADRVHPSGERGRPADRAQAGPAGHRSGRPPPATGSAP